MAAWGASLCGELMGTIAMVQARMGSTRLPGKVLAPLAGRPALARIVERLRAARGVDEVVVLTSRSPRDEAIVELCAARGIRCLRGSEHDVLDRFQQASQALDAQRIVRVTADCPLIDPEVVGRLLALAAAQPEDAYASVATGAIGADAGYRRYPDGLDAETFTARMLATAWREASDPYDREHVTPFIWRHPERFPVVVLEADEDLGEERWTIDHPADLELVRAVYEGLPEGASRPAGFREVLAVLARDPRLRALNAAHRVAG
jgi:spore coat polysaccharide biosynthesis protein SpsF